MTDIHTHILPGMDDGAATVEQSLGMLKSCKEQGVDTVVLTPHFYPWMEALDSFLERRAQAFRQLSAVLTDDMPRLVLGAEVAWYPNLDTMGQIGELALGESNCIMVEMPNAPWTETMLEQIERLNAVAGLVPILAHVERYLHLQKEGQIKRLQDMGAVMQLSAGMLLSPLKRRKAISLLKAGTWVLGSDCHDLEQRPPCLGPAIAKLETYSLENPDVILGWQPDMIDISDTTQW